MNVRAWWAGLEEPTSIEFEISETGHVSMGRRCNQIKGVESELRNAKRSPNNQPFIKSFQFRTFVSCFNDFCLISPLSCSIPGRIEYLRIRLKTVGTARGRVGNRNSEFKSSTRPLLVLKQHNFLFSEQILKLRGWKKASAQIQPHGSL